MGQLAVATLLCPLHHRPPLQPTQHRLPSSAGPPPALFPRPLVPGDSLRDTCPWANHCEGQLPTPPGGRVGRAAASGSGLGDAAFAVQGNWLCSASSQGPFEAAKGAKRGGKRDSSLALRGMGRGGAVPAQARPPQEATCAWHAPPGQSTAVAATAAAAQPAVAPTAAKLHL